MNKKNHMVNLDYQSLFSEKRCFLCGVELNNENGTKEHVFPEWLLHKYNLWDRKIALLNETPIPYRYLTIPCCSSCNSGELSRLEQEIKQAIDTDFRAVARIEKLRLYQWIGKIFYGLLFRELSLSFDRSRPELGSITSPKLMQDYLALHHFLQSTIKPIEFQGFFPGSIFIFEIEVLSEFDQFNYSDSIESMAFCVRMGNIGIVACLKDDEQVYDSLFEIYQAVKDVKLHPIQYDELCAIVFYQASILARDGKYISITTPENKTTIAKAPGYSLAPVFDDWNYEIFAHFLEKFWAKWGITFDDIFVPPDSTRTYLGEYL